jgi:hypothetical protein
MIDKGYFTKHLSKASCSKCGTSLGSAKFVPISELPLAVVGHAVCEACKSENMVTITTMGTGVVAMASDLSSEEVKKFISEANVTYNDVLELHTALENQSICSLLQKNEQSSEKKQKN